MGDNINKPRHQTLEHVTRSLHYFNSYATLYRIDLSGLSDIQPSVDMTSFDLSLVFPSAKQLMTGFVVLYLMHTSQHFKDLQETISHDYSKEMSEKSKVVSEKN